MKISGAFNVITTPMVRDCAEFYGRCFGFDNVVDLGWYVHLRHPSGVEVAFMEPDHPTQPPLYQPAWTGQGLIVSLEVPDARRAMAELESLGIPIAFELKEEEWGQIHFGVRDPNGIPIDIVQQLAA